MRSTTFRILAALSAGDADASELLDRLAEAGAGEGAPTVPTFYRRLKEALDAGWVEVSGLEGGGGPGRPGQRYRITRSGLSAARPEAVGWRRMAEFVLNARSVR